MPARSSQTKDMARKKQRATTEADEAKDYLSNLPAELIELVAEYLLA